MLLFWRMQGWKKHLCNSGEIMTHRKWFNVKRTVLVALVLFQASCAPLQVSSVMDDTFVNKFHKVSKPVNTKYYPECQILNSTALHCRIESEDTCSKTMFHTVDRTELTRRSTSTGVKLVEYLGAAGFLGGGIGVIFDAKNVPDSDDRFINNPVGRTETYLIGSGLLAIGATMLTIGIVDSFRALDENRYIGKIKVKKKTKQVICNPKHPLSKVKLRIAIGDTTITTIDTTQKGELKYDLDSSSVMKTFVVGESPNLSIAIFHKNREIEIINIQDYRKVLCVRKLYSVVEAKAWNKYRNFYKDFPNASNLIGSNEKLTELANNAAMIIDKNCDQQFNDKIEATCLEEIRKLHKHAPGNEKVIELKTRYQTRHLKNLYKKGKRLFARRKIDGVHDVIDKCKEVDESDAGCVKLAKIVEKYEQKIRRKEERKRKVRERRRKAKERKLRLWGKRHYKSAILCAKSEMKEKLKAPSTVKWISSKVLDYNINKFLVHLVFSAQNHFGVPIRNSYCVVLELNMKKSGRYSINKYFGVLKCGLYPTEREKKVLRASNGWEKKPDAAE